MPEKPEKKLPCRCWKCGKRYEMTEREVNAWGRDYECCECLDKASREFVRRMKRLGINIYTE